MKFRLIIPLVGACLLLIAGGLYTVGATQDAAYADADDGFNEFSGHPSIVPDEPIQGYPRILDTPTYVVNNRTLRRQTQAIEMIGDYIVSGGDFMNVELQNGTIVSQPYVAVFDSVTKALACPGLVVDGEIRALVRGHEPHTVILGGKFNAVTDANGTVTRRKVAKVNLDTCEVDPDWRVQGIDGKVNDFAIVGERLFLTGDFLTIEGQPIAHLAEINHKTAVLNPQMNFTFAGGAAWRKITTIGAKSDGTRLGVIGKFTSVNGNSMRGTAILDISDPNAPTLTAHRTATTSLAYLNPNAIRGGAIAPDFSYMILTQQGGINYDAVIQIPTVEAAGQLGWEQKMRDSVFSAAVSDQAVYVGGHFCRTDTGPGGAGVEMTPNLLSVCTGSNPAWVPPGTPGLWRSQLAALDPVTGTPLEWNPGTQALVGAKALTVVNRGLLVGHDSQYIHSPNPYTRVGTTAFFDFGAIADPRDGQTCTAVVNNDDSISLSWPAVGGVSTYEIIRNDVEIASTTATASTDSPGVGTWNYGIRSLLDGVVKDVACNQVEITPGGAFCNAVVNGDDTVTLDWDPVTGVDDYQLRRNGAWIASTGDVATIDDDPGVGTWTYEIRYWMNGAEDILCSPTVTIAPPAAPTCAAVVNADQSVTLTWTAVAGVTDYQLRRNGHWVTSIGNVLTIDDTPAAGTWTYEIRYWQGGAQDITCAPSVTTTGGPTPVCTAVGNADGTVTLVWDSIAGVTDYQLRRNGAWVASTGNVLTIDDDPGAGTWSYEIRYWQGGAQDIVCNPTITVP